MDKIHTFAQQLRPDIWIVRCGPVCTSWKADFDYAVVVERTDRLKEGKPIGMIWALVNPEKRPMSPAYSLPIIRHVRSLGLEEDWERAIKPKE